MKRLLFVLLFLPVLAFGQVSGQDFIVVSTDSSYASNDTTAWFLVSPLRDYFLTVRTACDTANFGIYIDFRGVGCASTTYDSYTVSDSTNYKGIAAGRLMYKGYDLTGHILGAQYVRLRIVKMSTGGDAGTQSYSAVLVRREM